MRPIHASLIMKSLGTVLLFSHLGACSDLVVKVDKKPRNVDLSGISSIDTGAQLADGADFLGDVDALRTLAADTIIKRLQSADHRVFFREKVRDFRRQIIDRVQSTSLGIPNFYTDGNQCREAGDFQINGDNGLRYLGLIMQTGILARLDQVRAASINTNLTGEMEAITQLIMQELGLDVHGEIQVDKNGEEVITFGELSIAVLSDANDDAQTKADDEGVIKIKFRRDYINPTNQTFVAAVAVEYPDQARSYGAVIDVKRHKNHDELLQQEISFAAGNASAVENDQGLYTIENATYSRHVWFGQKEAGKNLYAMTDTLFPDQEGEGVYMTEVDLDAKSQCKISITPVTPPTPVEDNDDSSEDPADDDASQDDGDDSEQPDADPTDDSGKDGKGDDVIIIVPDGGKDGSGNPTGPTQGGVSQMGPGQFAPSDPGTKQDGKDPETDGSSDSNDPGSDGSGDSPTENGGTSTESPSGTMPAGSTGGSTNDTPNGSDSSGTQGPGEGTDGSADQQENDPVANTPGEEPFA